MVGVVASGSHGFLEHRHPLWTGVVIWLALSVTQRRAVLIPLTMLTLDRRTLLAVWAADLLTDVVWILGLVPALPLADGGLPLVELTMV